MVDKSSPASDNAVIVYANKTVIKLTGLEIHGLDTAQVESMLMNRFQSMVRVIGVTGTSLEMDFYDIDPNMVYRNQDSLLEAVSLCDGISATEVASLSSAERIVELDWNLTPDIPPSDCLAERVLLMKQAQEACREKETEYG